MLDNLLTGLVHWEYWEFSVWRFKMKTDKWECIDQLVSRVVGATGPDRGRINSLCCEIQQNLKYIYLFTVTVDEKEIAHVCVFYEKHDWTNFWALFSLFVHDLGFIYHCFFLKEEICKVSRTTVQAIRPKRCRI